MDEIKELKYFFLVLFILAIAWLFTGGPLRPEADSGLFLNDPQGKREKEIQKGIEETVDSPTSDKSKVTIVDEKEAVLESPKDIVTLKKGKARETDPEKEYIEILADKKNKNTINISDWKVVGKNGLDLKIGQGTKLYLPGIDNLKESVLLEPGGKIILHTGHSPLGANLLLNKCTGYLDQEKKFSPRLPKECPLIENENLPQDLNDECLDFIEDISKCEIIDSIPMRLNSSCQNFLSEKVNYKSCADTHKNEADFYDKEWQVFLNRNEELWKQSREEIKLLNEKGGIIDSIAY